MKTDRINTILLVVFALVFFFFSIKVWEKIDQLETSIHNIEKVQNHG